MGGLGAEDEVQDGTVFVLSVLVCDVVSHSLSLLSGLFLTNYSFTGVPTSVCTWLALDGRSCSVLTPGRSCDVHTVPMDRGILTHAALRPVHFTTKQHLSSGLSGVMAECGIVLRLFHLPGANCSVNWKVHSNVLRTR